MTPAARGLMLGLTVGYFALMLLIGVWAARRTHGPREFFVAGGRLGLLVTGLATMSAAFSGFLFIGGPGLTYRLGIASLFICLPVGFTSGLLCWVVGGRLRLLAEIGEVYTIPEALGRRFRSRGVRAAAAVAVLVGIVGYLGSQMLALGIMTEMIFGTREMFGAWSLPVATGCGMLIVLAYSTAGGMLAGVYTDVVQGGMMVVTAVAVFACALAAGGGPGAIAEAIVGDPRFGAAFLEPFGRAPVQTALGLFFVFSIGTLGQPHLLHKFLMLDDPRSLRYMPAVLGGSQSACILLWLGIGLAVPALVARGALPALSRPDDATPAFVLGFAPPLLAALVFSGVLAAIMSTADSLVNIGSAALVRDLPRAFGTRLRSELRWGRAATVALLLAAAALALTYGDLVALLGTFAFGTMGAALAPVLALGLNWQRVGRRAATASIVTGLVTTLGLEFLARQSFLPGLPRPPLVAGALPGAVALATSFLVLIAVAAFERGERDLAKDDPVRAVLEM